jgi:hypothetical protein
MQIALFLRHVMLHRLWPVWLYHIFPHYLVNDTIFGKHVFGTNRMF